jgi:hypothetical protein
MVRGRVRGGVLYGGMAVLVLVAGVLGVVIWRTANSDDTVVLPPLATATGTASSEPIDDASTRAIAAYNGYWDTFVKAAANPAAPTPDLATYVADPLLTELRLTLRQIRDQGIVYKGRPTSSPRATSSNTTTAPFSVAIEDCFDSTDWVPVYSANGQSAAAPGQASRYVITSTMKLFDANGWLVVETAADRGRAC